MKVRSMVQCSLFAALLCICAWLSVPTPTGVISLQTFGLFLALGVLGGKKGSIACALYLLLGLVGLPVFTGFQGGMGVLLGPTGGFLWGFPVSALLYWLLTALRLPVIFSMAAAQLACYGCGLGWYLVYSPATPFGAAVLVCIAPYLVPDALKLLAAAVAAKKISRLQA